MKKLITIVLITIFSSCFAQTKFEKKYENGILKETGFFDKNGLNDSIWKQYNEAGILIGEGYFSHGVKTGIWKIYFDNGKLMYEIPYINGKKKGQGKQFTPEGELLAIREY